LHEVGFHFFFFGKLSLNICPLYQLLALGQKQQKVLLSFFNGEIICSIGRLTRLYEIFSHCRTSRSPECFII